MEPSKLTGRHGNLIGVDQYLHHVWTRSTTLTVAIRRRCPSIDKALFNRFKDHTQAIQERLTRNLEAEKYDIDGEDTLSRIRGPGPIEKVNTFNCQRGTLCNCFFFSTFSLFYISS